MNPLDRLKQLLKELLHRQGLDLVPILPAFHEGARRRRLLQYHQIDTVLDVGANIGQFASGLREELGYRERIVSFEPLANAFAELQARSQHDPLWDVHRYALGRSDTTQKIHVARNSVSSSIFEMLPAHESAAPESKYVATEDIEVRALDSVFHDLDCDGRQLLLKIDTQGYEAEVLHGAHKSLAATRLVQIEMSLCSLYDGQPLFPEMLKLMLSVGFEPISFETGFVDPHTGHTLQVDGFFTRS
ncbi:MAG: FkbM family methyltransferase [Hyphomicrobiaceae bacterium]|jgi:FkbM family methyltransferase